MTMDRRDDVSPANVGWEIGQIGIAVVIVGSKWLIGWFVRMRDHGKGRSISERRWRGA
jgi:hypothetical protein